MTTAPAADTREHSPFIRAVLGPVADQVRPWAPRQPYAHVADEWLELGVGLIGTDTLSAVEAISWAVCYGSDEAMAWLGRALLHYATDTENLPLPQGVSIAIAGLGWLDTASQAGDAKAGEWLVEALDLLPPFVVERWASLPAHSQVAVH